jgi:signal transduction histidine kinase/HAMP domain-containing protein
MWHMARPALDRASAHRPSRQAPRIAPTLGLRGGLGKTLLIAFLLLAIVPLSLLALLTYHQIQRDTGQKLILSLETMVALKESHLLDWVGSYERELTLLADDLNLGAGGPDERSQAALAQALSTRLATVQAADPALLALLLVDQKTDQVIATAGPADLTAGLDPGPLRPLLAEGRRLLIVPAGQQGDSPLLAVTPSEHAWTGWRLIGLLNWDTLRQIIADARSPDTMQGITTSFVTSDGLLTSGQGLAHLPSSSLEALSGGALPEGISRALQGQSGSGAYTNLAGIPVFGAYRWNPELQIALLAEQPQTQALAAANTLTAMVLGVTLAMALITAAIAAFVTRRLTIPIVQLTETAAWMARGDLNQEVNINRRDEIGILARAFNRMAAELRILYGELEAKVAERTQQLGEANERIRYHATQLALSAEVARIITSIRDLDLLLTTVADLIGRAFELHHVAIYLLDDGPPGRAWAVCRASSNAFLPLPAPECADEATFIGRVASGGHRQVVRASAAQDGGSREPESPTPTGTSADLAVVPLPGREPLVACELAIPLHSRERILGVLDLQSSRPDDFDENDQMVYQSLADQISIAIENARAYAAEHETVEKLRELDRIQSQFLTNMSHALRTPLTSIIGFSRVMLKELDGPLTDLQRADLDAIHQGGRQLLGLINDMLELSQLDLGTAPFSLAEVDLGEIVEGVMATAQALARGKPVHLYEETPPDLPLLHTDGQRVRQVILALLSNAVKFTDKGSIHLRVSQNGGDVIISVTDTGAGIPQAEWAKLFSDSRRSESEADRDTPGFGLAISKRVVEKLGGQIWVESQEGAGSAFTFTLPVRPAGLESQEGG